MSDAAWNALRDFLDQTEGNLRAVAVAGIGDDGCAHTMFVGGDRVFLLVGASAYLHHRLLTEAIEPNRPADEVASGPHQVDGTWLAPQVQQDEPRD